MDFHSPTATTNLQFHYIPQEWNLLLVTPWKIFTTTKTIIWPPLRHKSTYDWRQTVWSICKRFLNLSTKSISFLTPKSWFHSRRNICFAARAISNMRNEQYELPASFLSPLELDPTILLSLLSRINVRIFEF